MESFDVRSLIGLSMLVLAGGGVTSFGVTSLVRSSSGRKLVARWRWWGIAGYYASVAAVVVGGVWWIMRLLVAGGDTEAVLQSPWFFLSFGAVVGIPFTLSPVTTVWRERLDRAKIERRKQKAASRQDRLEFARDLERQLQEFAGEDRSISLELSGDKGKILVARGDLKREEAERLVKALHRDFDATGFTRFEGGGDNGWWVRI